MDRRKRGEKSDNKEQSRRFIEAARELGCDDNEEQFKETLRVVAKHRRTPKRARRPSSAKR